MILFPSAAGTVNVLPSMSVPAGAVVNGLDMANVLQPTCAKRASPRMASGVAASTSVSGRSHRAAYELGKVVDVLHAKIIYLIVDARCGQEEPL